MGQSPLRSPPLVASPPLQACRLIKTEHWKRALRKFRETYALLIQLNRPLFKELAEDAAQGVRPEGQGELCVEAFFGKPDAAAVAAALALAEQQRDEDEDPLHEEKPIRIVPSREGEVAHDMMEVLLTAIALSKGPLHERCALMLEVVFPSEPEAVERDCLLLTLLTACKGLTRWAGFAMPTLEQIDAFVAQVPPPPFDPGAAPKRAPGLAGALQQAVDPLAQDPASPAGKGMSLATAALRAKKEDDAQKQKAAATPAVCRKPPPPGYWSWPTLCAALMADPWAQAYLALIDKPVTMKEAREKMTSLKQTFEQSLETMMRRRGGANMIKAEKDALKKKQAALGADREEEAQRLEEEALLSGKQQDELSPKEVLFVASAVCPATDPDVLFDAYATAIARCEKLGISTREVPMEEGEVPDYYHKLPVADTQVLVEGAMAFATLENGAHILAPMHFPHVVALCPKLQAMGLEGLHTLEGFLEPSDVLHLRPTVLGLGTWAVFRARQLHEELLHQAFNRYDTDGSGCIDTAEFTEVIAEMMRDQICPNEKAVLEVINTVAAKVARDLLCEIDQDGSMEIDFQEFKEAIAVIMQKQNEIRSAIRTMATMYDLEQHFDQVRDGESE